MTKICLSVFHCLYLTYYLFCSVLPTSKSCNSINMENTAILQDLTISCLNVNSLNMSNVSKEIQLRKILGIVKLKSDLIFLSDTRLSNRNLVSCKEDVTKILLNNTTCSYRSIFNSTKNKRGVGILINSSLDFTEVRRSADQDENYILLLCQIQGKRVIIGSIYGPNTYAPDFFVNLERDIIGLGEYPIVLGGDWNTTFSTLPVDINPDCFNMTNCPNPRHAVALNELCNSLGLTDPYRALSPNDRNFTYVPRSVAATNRSRIDFFLISDSLLRSINYCKISDNLQSNLFDHKSVLLAFSGRRMYGKASESIDNKILGDPDIGIIVELAVKECHVIYQDLPRDIKNNILLSIGTARNNIRLAGIDKKFYNLAFDPDQDPDIQVERRNDLLVPVINFIRSDEFQNLVVPVKNIEDDMFFEMLMNHVRNELISYQSYVFREKNKTKRELIERLATLRSNVAALDPAPELNMINALENQLRLYSEREIEAALESHPIFEHLNGEKMSSRFLKLAKQSNKGCTINDIMDNDGNIFVSDAVREEYITSYYENIYKVPENSPSENEFDDLIINFLGEDICNHPLVLGSKLTVAEAERINNDISIQELDESVAEAKLRTAPGRDGFSNEFIKKFWTHFRVPLHKYTKKCFEKKKLTDSFRVASIKLIPKKGDISKLKNWRPISLLNCFYKVISRAVNSRLKKFSDRYTSRAQKGFTSSRRIQEVLLNISESIAYCNNKNIAGAIVSIDQAKAFDTILHGFVKSAFKFFGFQDPFINMLETLGTDRCAQIITPTGVTRRFKLGTGRPQGGNLSPLEFNAGEQLLLFKIELDPQILSIFSGAEVPRNLFPVDIANINKNFFQECNNETDKADGFADDTSAGTIMEINSLTTLKNVLTDFGTISGLQCNFDKTFILQIGNKVDATDILNSTGFSLTNELTLLGFRLNSDGIMCNDMFQELYVKISNIITSWDRYRLSMPGRIGIYKTLLLSQISYIGSICTPSENMLNNIQNLIDNFVMGPLAVSKERRYIPPSDGGLGLINLKNFLTGLQASWVKKAAQCSRDNWRIDIKSLSGGNCFCFCSQSFNREEHPVLWNIAVSYNRFTSAFFNQKDNFKEAFVFNNQCIRRDPMDAGILDRNFFEQNIPRLNLDSVSRLKVKDFISGEQFKSLDEITLDTGINFSLVTYMRLRTAIMNSIREAKRLNNPNIQGSLENFFRPKNGEAKRIRQLLDRGLNRKSINQLQIVKTYCNLTGYECAPNTLGKIFGFWNMHYLPNKLREFLFKFTNNRLGLNVRLSHFVANQSRLCSNCTKSGVPDPDEETFGHLFMRCPTTRRIQEWFISKYFLQVPATELGRIKLVFFGIRNDKFSEFVFLAVTVVNYLVWEMKLQKRIITPVTMDINFRYLMKYCFKFGPKLRAQLAMLGENVNNRLTWLL
jgi:exonuclease III